MSSFLDISISNKTNLCYAWNPITPQICYVWNTDVEKTRHFNMFHHVISTWLTYINTTSARAHRFHDGCLQGRPLYLHNQIKLYGSGNNLENSFGEILGLNGINVKLQIYQSCHRHSWHLQAKVDGGFYIKPNIKSKLNFLREGPNEWNNYYRSPYPKNPLLFLAFTLSALLGVPRGSQGKDSEPVWPHTNKWMNPI